MLGDTRSDDDAVALCHAWSARADQREVPPGAEVALGFAMELGTVGLRLETLDGYQFTPVYSSLALSTVWNPADWGGQVPRLEVDAALDEVMGRYNVVRGYFDPPYWESEIDAWAARYGDKRVFRWPTHRRVARRAASARLLAAVTGYGTAFRHDNQTEPDRAAVLAHEAACDATVVISARRG